MQLARRERGRACAVAGGGARVAVLAARSVLHWCCSKAKTEVEHVTEASHTAEFIQYSSRAV